MATTASATTKTVEFDLGGQAYCVDIGYITEVTAVSNLTPLPNAGSHVRGVMDLRGQATSIIDPTVLLGVESSNDGEAVLVFDPDATGDDALGWVVDEVTKVTDVDEADIDTGPVANSDGVRGIVHRDDEFVIWVEPDAVSQ